MRIAETKPAKCNKKRRCDIIYLKNSLLDIQRISEMEPVITDEKTKELLTYVIIWMIKENKE
ncbi:hypothetical protein JXL19_04150 [bacterium]|nr:hypothetical protein [bacterium]